MILFLKKLFSPLLLITSLLVFSYIFYRSEIFWDGSRREYFSKYYIFAITIIIISISSFFFNSKVKIYFIIIFLSLATAVYVFELYLTLKLSESEKIKIFKDLKKNNENVSLRHSPWKWLKENDNFLPLSGKSFSKTIDCNENGYFSINEHDRYGFNNPDSEWNNKHIDYLLIGDSFTYGSCVNRPDNIASQLLKLSNGSVINLGFPANGPLLEYATLREYYSPKIKKVLWLYFEKNDLYGLKEEKKNNILIKYLEDLEFTQNLRFNQRKIDDFTLRGNLNKLEQYKPSSRILRFMTLVLTRQFSNQSNLKLSSVNVNTENNLDDLKNILYLSKQFVEEYNSKIYFIYLPEYRRYKKNYDDASSGYLSVKEIMKELDIPIIDIHTEIFEKEKNPLKFFSLDADSHYNPEGYRKVAETIYKYTKD